MKKKKGEAAHQEERQSGKRSKDSGEGCTIERPLTLACFLKLKQPEVVGVNYIETDESYATE